MTLIGGFRGAVASATAEKDAGTGTCTRYVAKERRREVVVIANTGLKRLARRPRTPTRSAR